MIAPRRRPRGIASALAGLLLVLLPLSSCSKSSPLQPSTGVYDFSLVDVNPNSPTYGQTVSSTSFAGKPLVLFIGAATWSFCQRQFAALNDISQYWPVQNLDAVPLFINIIGAESGVTTMTQGRTMPVLQDTPSAKVVGRFGLAKDDVVILDRQSKFWRLRHTDATFNFYTEPGISTLDTWVHTVP